MPRALDAPLLRENGDDDDDARCAS